MIKKIAVSISIILFSTLVGVIAIEVAVRVLNMESSIFIVYDKCVGYKNIPNKTGYFVGQDSEAFIETNEDGFRDVDHEAGKSDKFRILMLGDSFTEGRQVSLEDTFFRQVEEKFNLMNKNVEVVSLGMSGYGTNNSVQALKCYGLKYNPDLVILNFFNGNDIHDNYFNHLPHSPRFYLEGDFLVLDEAYSEYIKEKRNTLKYRFSTFAESHMFSFRFILAKFLISEEDLVKLLDHLIQVYNKEYDDEWNTAWSLTKALVSEIKIISEENDAEFIIIQIPSFVEFPEKRKSKEKYDLYNFNRSREMVSDFARESGVEHIDLFDVFVADRLFSFDDVHFSNDHHFNEAGHDVVSDVIVEYILENNMLHE